MGMCKLLLILLFVPFVSLAQSPMFKLIAKKASTGCTPDADATAFISAASITDPTEQSAICVLVASLKSNSLWTLFDVIYPVVGGTSSTCSYNLKNPATYQASFTGGWTFLSTGMQPNGTTGYGNTGYNTNVLTADDSHFSIYSRTNSVGADLAGIGAYDGGTNLLSIYARNTGDLLVSDQYTYTTGRISVSNTDSRAYFISSRTASNLFTLYKNGSSVGSQSSLGGSLFAQPFYFGAMNLNGTAGQFSNREIAFVTIGKGLTSGQVSTLNTIVETFQDALGRGVQ